MTVTLHGAVAEFVRDQIAVGAYQSPEDLVHEAIEALGEKRLHAHIAEGLADIEAGRYRELTKENIKEIAKSIVAESIR